jgi:hypothetical protein
MGIAGLQMLIRQYLFSVFPTFFWLFLDQFNIN